MKQVRQEENSVYSVEFYPTVEDYAYISTRLARSVPVSPATTYAYYIFLFLNTIVFPAFLWINDYFVAGLAVLVINIAVVIFITPRLDSDSYRKFYRHLFGTRENKIAKVSLNENGTFYETEDGYSFCAWRRIESVEETEESIYFFFEGNGFAVRKNGFPYPEDAKMFIEYSRQNVQMARPQLAA